MDARSVETVILQNHNETARKAWQNADKAESQ